MRQSNDVWEVECGAPTAAAMAPSGALYKASNDTYNNNNNDRSVMQSIMGRGGAYNGTHETAENDDDDDDDDSVLRFYANPLLLAVDDAEGAVHDKQQQQQQHSRRQSNGSEAEDDNDDDVSGLTMRARAGSLSSNTARLRPASGSVTTVSTAYASTTVTADGGGNGSNNNNDSDNSSPLYEQRRKQLQTLPSTVLDAFDWRADSKDVSSSYGPSTTSFVANNNSNHSYSSSYGFNNNNNNCSSNSVMAALAETSSLSMLTTAMTATPATAAAVLQTESTLMQQQQHVAQLQSHQQQQQQSMTHDALLAQPFGGGALALPTYMPLQPPQPPRSLAATDVMSLQQQQQQQQAMTAATAATTMSSAMLRGYAVTEHAGNVYSTLAEPPICATALHFRRFWYQKHVPPHIAREESTGVFVGQLPSSYTEDDVEALLKAIGNESGQFVQVRDVKCHNRERTCAFVVVNAGALQALLAYTKRVLCDVHCVWVVTEAAKPQLALFVQRIPRGHLRNVPKGALVLERLTPQLRQVPSPSQQQQMQLQQRQQQQQQQLQYSYQQQQLQQQLLQQQQRHAVMSMQNMSSAPMLMAMMPSAVMPPPPSSLSSAAAAAAATLSLSSFPAHSPLMRRSGGVAPSPFVAAGTAAAPYSFAPLQTSTLLTATSPGAAVAARGSGGLVAAGLCGVPQQLHASLPANAAAAVTAMALSPVASLSSTSMSYTCGVNGCNNNNNNNNSAAAAAAAAASSASAPFPVFASPTTVATAVPPLCSAAASDNNNNSGSGSSSPLVSLEASLRDALHASNSTVTPPWPTTHGAQAPSSECGAATQGNSNAASTTNRVSLPMAVTLPPVLPTTHCSCNNALILSHMARQATCSSCHGEVDAYSIAYWCAMGHLCMCTACAVKTHDANGVSSGTAAAA